jgi:hypothetical protein
MSLETLWKLQEAVATLDQATAHAIKKGHMRQAKKLLEQRLTLINSAFIRELLGFVSLQAEKENLADVKLIQFTANQWDSFQHLLRCPE